jgi:hypothetical protein
MIRQARIGDTVLVKSKEMTGRTQILLVAGGRRGKDDRKQNTLALLPNTNVSRLRNLPKLSEQRSLEMVGGGGVYRG